MKLVFAHDHKLRKIGNNYYTTGGLSDKITGRYLKYFDELTIFCRVIKKQSYDTNLFKIKNPNIKIKAISYSSLFFSKRKNKMMEEEVKNSDALIVKLHSLIAERAIKYARKHNVPYLVEVVGDPWDAYWNHGIIGKIIAPRMMWRTRKEIKRAPYAIYVTKEYLEKKYPCSGKWMACSDVELKNVNVDVLNKRLKKIKDLRKNQVLTLGTLAQVDVPYKGQEYVIKALSYLKKDGIYYKYRLAGMGNPERLKRIAKRYGVLDQIEFDGVIDHSNVFNWLDSIDIYVQPSKQEGLPRSVVEAFSRACPAIGSKTGGIPELINSKCLFNKGNVSEIVSLLMKVDKQKLKEQAKENFEIAQSYDKALLDTKRNKFYKYFSEKVKDGLKQ